MGMISFISSLFCRGASNKVVTKLSGFLATLGPYDQVVADKGFLIFNKLATRLCFLAIPPGKRGNTQMTPAQVAKNKVIVEQVIVKQVIAEQVIVEQVIVEQVIPKLARFKILKNMMPITLFPHADGILVVCLALCNLQTPINTWCSNSCGLQPGTLHVQASQCSHIHNRALLELYESVVSISWHHGHCQLTALSGGFPAHTV